MPIITAALFIEPGRRIRHVSVIFEFDDGAKPERNAKSYAAIGEETPGRIALHRLQAKHGSRKENSLA